MMLLSGLHHCNKDFYLSRYFHNLFCFLTDSMILKKIADFPIIVSNVSVDLMISVDQWISSIAFTYVDRILRIFEHII